MASPGAATSRDQRAAARDQRAARAELRQHWTAHHRLTLAEAEHNWLARRAAQGLHGPLANLVPDHGADEVTPYRAPATHQATGLAPLDPHRKRQASPPQGTGKGKRAMLEPPPFARPGRSPSPRSPASDTVEQSHRFFDVAMEHQHDARHTATPGIFRSPRAASDEGSHPARPIRPADTELQSCRWGSGHQLVWRETQAIAKGHFGQVYLAEELDGERRVVSQPHCVKIVTFGEYRNFGREITASERKEVVLELYHDCAKECVACQSPQKHSSSA